MPEVVALLGCELCLDAVQLQSVIFVHSILVPINSAAELVGSMPWRRFGGQRQIDQSAGIFSLHDMRDHEALSCIAQIILQICWKF